MTAVIFLSTHDPQMTQNTNHLSGSYPLAKLRLIGRVRCPIANLIFCKASFITHLLRQCPSPNCNPSLIKTKSDIWQTICCRMSWNQSMPYGSRHLLLGSTQRGGARGDGKSKKVNMTRFNKTMESEQYAVLPSREVACVCYDLKPVAFLPDSFLETSP